MIMESNMSITSLDNLKTHSSLQQIISADEQIEPLLRSIGIKTEHYKEKTLLQLCSEKKWNEEELLSWLQKEAMSNDEQLEESNHKYSSLNHKQLLSNYKKLSRSLLQISDKLESDFHRVCKVHGIQYPVIKDIHWHLKMITEKTRFMLMLIDKNMSPLLMTSYSNSDSILDGTVRNFERAVKLVERDRLLIRKHIQKISEINSHPEKIEGACGTMRTAFRDLEKQFEFTELLIRLLEDGIIPTLGKEINKL